MGTDFPYFPSRRLSDCGRRYRALALWPSRWTALRCVCAIPFAVRGALLLGVVVWMASAVSILLLVPQPSRSKSGQRRTTQHRAQSTGHRAQGTGHITAQHSTAHSLPFTVVCCGCAHFSRSVAAPPRPAKQPRSQNTLAASRLRCFVHQISSLRGTSSARITLVTRNDHGRRPNFAFLMGGTCDAKPHPIQWLF